MFAPTSGKAPSRHPILPERQPTSRLRMLAFLRRSSGAARLLPTVKPFCKTPRERVHFSVVVLPGAVCQSILSSLEDSKGAQKQPIKKRQTTQSQGAYFFHLQPAVLRAIPVICLAAPFTTRLVARLESRLQMPLLA